MPSSGLSSKEAPKLWKSVLGRLEIELNKPTYKTFLQETEAIAFEENQLVVEAPSIFICDGLNNRLKITILHALAAITTERIEVLFIPEGKHPAKGIPTRTRDVIGRIQEKLNLDNYIQTTGNRRALSICRNVTDEISGAISPIIISGESGFGKTHLLHAIANEAAIKNWPIGIFTAEEFTTTFMESVRDSKLTIFQKKMRSRKLLVIDDFEELAGKSGTQKELMRTVDAINSNNGHIIIGCSGPLKTFSIIESLKSRLEAGISTEIAPPFGEEQRDFIYERLQTLKTSLPNWAVEKMITTNFKNIRTLQSTVHGAIILEREKVLGPEQFEALLIANRENDPNKASIKSQLSTITQSFGLTEEAIKGRGRSKKEIEARAITAASLRRQGSSYGTIAALLGGRDRSTIRGLVHHGETLAAHDSNIAKMLTGP